MKSKIVFGIGVFLLLGGLLASELGLHFLTERIPIVSPSYRGWGEPDFYRLNREDSNAGHKWLVFLKLTGVVSLVGFTLVYLELRKGMVPTQRGPGTVEGLTKSVEPPGPPLKIRSVIEDLNVHRTVHTSFPGRVALPQRSAA